ncbi:MAG: hypothetical protein E2O67_01590 [Deltaproteobacteria bacterium]|nr:MAG: hypothetical protein E2O67_01590 [Deltaproteobacteria bacterium]
MVRYITLSLLIVSLFSNTSVLEENSHNKMDKKSIKTVLEENTDFLMSIQGVVGIAQGLCEDKDCIKVFVTKKTDKIHEQIPKSLDGYMIEIVETDVIKAY